MRSLRTLVLLAAVLPARAADLRVAPDVRPLNAEGFVVLPVESFIRPDEAQAILSQVDRHWDPAEPSVNIHLLDHNTSRQWAKAAAVSKFDRQRNASRVLEAGRGWSLKGRREYPELLEKVRAIEARISEALRAQLPEERLFPGQVQLRMTRDPAADGQAGDEIHLDGGHLTFTYALRGPGTILYHVKPEGVSEHPTPDGFASIISNGWREQMTGIPATPHVAPSISEPRVLLLIRYFTAEARRPPPETAALKAAMKARIQAVRQFLAGYRPAI